MNNTSTEIIEKDKILSIFSNKDDIDAIMDAMNIDLDKIPTGMTLYQIENFILNKREFTNDLFQYQQAKVELYTRLQGFIDLYYQLRESRAKIKLAEGRIDELQNDSRNTKVKEAKIELHQIEIDKNKFKITIIEQQAKQKLRETVIFSKEYQNLKYLEDLPDDALQKMEDEGWKIKSAYYPELFDRYQVTPRGRIALPHETGGLKALLNIQNKQLKG